VKEVTGFMYAFIRRFFTAKTQRSSGSRRVAVLQELISLFSSFPSLQTLPLQRQKLLISKYAIL